MILARSIPCTPQFRRMFDSFQKIVVSAPLRLCGEVLVLPKEELLAYRAANPRRLSSAIVASIGRPITFEREPRTATTNCPPKPCTA